MKALLSFFRGLRGKLTLTYTLVTVFSLLALEMMVLLGIVAVSSLFNIDKRNYLQDVIYTLPPKASQYLQPGKQDLPGLQAWLDKIYASGEASLPPADVFDSPIAPIVKSDPVYVLSPEGTVLAQAPINKNSLIGRRYTLPAFATNSQILERAMQNGGDSLRLSTRTPQGNYLMALPINEKDRGSDVVGVIILTVRPPTPMLLTLLPLILGWVLVTGLILLMGVAPFGAVFGYIMSRGLTRRLGALTTAADAWSEGDFQTVPQDRSNDEIGFLAMRMRRMAERVQALLQTQQALAMMEERNRLARELHDTVKQQTFATLMQVRAARKLIDSDPESARGHLEEAEKMIKSSQQELGLIIAELRPAALEGQGLPQALNSYVDTWSQQSTIPATFEAHHERSLPLVAEQTLYRVAQEALANVARHSRASAVMVRLDYQPSQIRMVIADNGVGFERTEKLPAGFGLQSMQERLAALGGKLDLDSLPDSGTTLTATLPCE